MATILDTVRQNVTMCEACGIKPKYVDPSGTQHSYCGRSCARTGVGKAAPECLLRGCSNTGTAFNGFCSVDHAKKGNALSSPSAHPGHKTQLQTHNHNDTGRTKPKAPSDVVHLSEIPSSATVWREFVREWNSKWLSLEGSALVEKLYEISYPASISDAQDKYLQGSQTTGQAHILRTFHASQCICDMGTKGPTLCKWNSCGICNVVGSAFRSVAFGVQSNIGRQGKGLYSSRNPASADRFATSCLSSPYRVMIACDVVLPQHLDKSNSVVAGDRVVVRVSDAIIPRFIVMYTKQT
ncbi:uncharacterized protein F5891DRAFT_230765 [Suillus fuscotomentosus]|uniref:PARP catalytic domain-containing protein n=1 Tax=Suillus fuscotomentosus TaxID=1912939 RepID=A0AAD4E8P9_9AGAM|nr:uncharacterized protein F5891DRAFT_230765 [Suillus fuscotomentosus]KAG1901778.1 hypothetical protein F5891DRAFT_230765 [Suillus fuscotomentosus]